ncbi:4576_t:CDS:1 [Ambispora gerdemannii]|uniref:4576_t:CDS:1 n=1 Tax=Ambispora gerdemannii TaxID=144530 RepID=A0A9N9FG32_9GLOM|nr:4576_t:CDS:1 [Ambispora gerdemannii]
MNNNKNSKDTIPIDNINKNTAIDIGFMKELLNKLLALKSSGQPDQNVVDGLEKWINQTNRDIKTIFKFVERHHANNPEFVYLFGYLIHYGLGTDADPVTAFKYYSYVAESGINYGQSRVAWCFRLGLGVEADSVKSFEWFKKAAENNHLISQFNMGLFYCNGTGTEQNLEMGFKWFQVAANRGNELAQFELAKMYLSGKWIKKDYRKANYWMWKGADYWMWKDANDCNVFVTKKNSCLFSLASNAANGMGVKRDLHQTFRLYRSILNNGHLWSQWKSRLQSLIKP